MVSQYTISTFTDSDCPYCRKMHKEIGQLTDAGLRLRYMLFPRTEVGWPSYVKAISAWCADKRQEVMTRAKLGEIPELPECENPVMKHMQLARSLVLHKPPMTITDRGKKLDGYPPAASRQALARAGAMVDAVGDLSRVSLPRQLQPSRACRTEVDEHREPGAPYSRSNRARSRALRYANASSCHLNGNRSGR